MYYIKCYRQTTILKPNERQEPSEVNGQKTTKWNQNQKPKATSHKPSEAKWSQVKPKPKAKSQKPKAKSQVGTQMRDSGSKMHAKHRF